MTDDPGAASAEAIPIQQVLDITGKFATLTGQVLNATKSHVWTTCSERQSELLTMNVSGELVPSTRGGRLLGAHVAFSRNVRNDLALKRIERGQLVCERIRWAPLPMAIRARLLSALVMPATLYGSCVGGLSANSVNSLTTAVMRAVWGTTRKLRCRDIVLTLFVQGHLVDPRQAYTYQCLCTLRRNLQKYPELVHVMQRCWHSCVVEGLSAPGPLGIVSGLVVA